MFCMAAVEECELDKERCAQVQQEWAAGALLVCENVLGIEVVRDSSEAPSIFRARD